MTRRNATPDVLKPLFRGLPVILAVMFFSVLAAKRYLHYTTPLYESTVKIKLADTKDGVPNSNLYKNFDVFTSTNKIGTEVEVLRSEALIEKVIDRVNISTAVFRVGDLHKKELYDESPVTVVPGLMSADGYDRPFKMIISNRDHLKVTLPDGTLVNGLAGQEIKTRYGSFIIRHNDSLLTARPLLLVDDHYEFVINSRKKLISGIIADLDVTSVDKDIPVLRVSYKCPVARKSADIVNAVAATYIEDYIQEKYRSADTTETFLTNQLKDYSGKLNASEAQIQQYRDNKNIINIHQETETNLRKVADLKKQLASVQMNLEAIDSLNHYIKNGKDNFTELAPNFEAFTDLLSTEMVKDMKHLQADKEDLLTRYTPENEKVAVVDKKISDLSEYLQESIRNTETNLRIKYNDLNQTIHQSEAEFIGLPEKERNMTVLERNFGLNEQIYRFLQEKRTDATIAKAATISFHRILSAGEVPAAPVSPNAKLIIVFSGFLGLLFSIIGIYSIHRMKARVDNETVIYRNSDSGLAYSIPYCKTARQKNTLFNHWVLELELKQQLKEGTVICISSDKKEEGKHFTATGLAAALAALGKKVLLVGISGSIDPGANAYQQAVPGKVNAQWRIPAVWSSMIQQWKEVTTDLSIVPLWAYCNGGISRACKYNAVPLAGPLQEAVADTWQGNAGIAHRYPE
ncbi:chain length determinant protein [Ostertagia ostertagi]